jgi:ubiquinone/menaquinone biosynthesis C-methylase UbiE
MPPSHDTIVDHQFGPQALAYVQSATHAVGPDLDRIETLAREYRPARALDLGCGGGHVAYRVAPYAGRVVACDLSPAMLDAVAAEAQRRAIGNIVTQAAAAERLPFADAAFDFTLCRMSAHHWHDLDAGLREARRVTRTGAQAMFIDTIAPASPLVDTHLQSIELLRDPSHVRNYSLDQWSSALARAGFAISRITTHALPLAFAPWIARMRTTDTHIAAIRSLQRSASETVRRGLDLQEDGSFAITVGSFELIAA